MDNKISMQRLFEIKEEFAMMANENSMQTDFYAKPSKIMGFRSYSSGLTTFRKYKV